MARSSQARVMRADVAGDALAGDPADARADFLDRRHQREAEQHHPAHRIAELRAGLRVGGDAAGVVVGGAGDQSRAEPCEQPLAGRARGARWRAMRAASTAWRLARAFVCVMPRGLPSVAAGAVCPSRPCRPARLIRRAARAARPRAARRSRPRSRRGFGGLLPPGAHRMWSIAGRPPPSRRAPWRR